MKRMISTLVFLLMPAAAFASEEVFMCHPVSDLPYEAALQYKLVFNSRWVRSDYIQFEGPLGQRGKSADFTDIKFSEVDFSRPCPLTTYYGWDQNAGRSKAIGQFCMYETSTFLLIGVASNTLYVQPELLEGAQAGVVYLHSEVQSVVSGSKSKDTFECTKQ